MSTQGTARQMLLRGADAGRTVERLDKAGGTVVGLVPDVTLSKRRSGAQRDLLVIYTDGFSEAMSPQLEEWGETAAREAVTSCDGLSAKDAIGKIMQAADAFAAGAPQSDDMTLVILHIV